MRVQDGDKTLIENIGYLWNGGTEQEVHEKYIYEEASELRGKLV